MKKVLVEKRGHKKNLRKPPWLKRDIIITEKYAGVRRLIQNGRFHTVCQEAQCPNIWECFSQGTATFLIMGPGCTRNCRFCNVRHGHTSSLNPEEPDIVAEAVKDMGLSYVVITSVTRDDLPFGGACHFSETIKKIRKKIPGVFIEALVPDFQGKEESIKIVLDALPDVLSHNIDTIPRIYPAIKPEAHYIRSIKLLMKAREYNPKIIIKSGLMLGLGETKEEVKNTLLDLIEAGCMILTLGQYLQPTRNHFPVECYISPEEFHNWKKTALDLGFYSVTSGPFVRSSYHADEDISVLAALRETIS